MRVFLPDGLFRSPSWAEFMCLKMMGVLGFFSLHFLYARHRRMDV